MLIRLLRTFLRKYRGLLLAVLGLQGVQAIASLYLPSLNANIIDKGVVAHNTHYIWTIGAFMLLVTLVQITFNIAAVYYGSRAAMGFGRDVRSALFHRVTEFSAREVNVFGAPSLITASPTTCSRCSYWSRCPARCCWRRRSRSSAASSWRCARTPG